MLKDIHSPSQIKSMSVRELESLAEEIRQALVETVANNGGHLASNLGMVELTLAMHYVFDCPQDKFVFDVGHQSYVHKLLTGRYEGFSTLRHQGGLSGFPNPDESVYDTFVAGHASNAISAALGMARTRDVMHGENNVIAVVGDGALTGGMCYEALNDAGQSATKLIVILNDNEMSISPNVGALSQHLSRLRQSQGYAAFKRTIRRGLEKIPLIGGPIFHFIGKLRDAVKALFVDGKFFETLGFVYVGPVDGHNIKRIIRILRRVKKDNRPTLLHFVTQKGKGYKPAENAPVEFHGVAPFYVDSGRTRSDGKSVSCGSVIASQLSEMAESDIRLCVICAAMKEGTGMSEFAEKHPERFFDVGIAEEHAVTMAAGMAATGMKPYVAIYSTFLQRAYDQMLIDVCRCNLPVTFLVDRAGFVGADGRTHQGLYDLSYFRSMPNMVVAAPRDARDLKRLIELSAQHNGPMAIRYPKDGLDLGPGLASQRTMRVGEWELLSDGEDVMIFAVGPMVQLAMQATIELMGRHIRAGVVDARFIKPMDEKLLLEKSKNVALVVTLEENSVCGGLGEGIVRLLSEKIPGKRCIVIAAPDEFVSHGRITQQRARCGLTATAVCDRISEAFANGEGA